ncbi:MAG: efflux RND transporter periplasmic adaptor subunit [Gammaproteobacteria bacterium]|nr:efflux RND transporter periplasmic adaptor subunit [Gammaproteobacteria bacterium]NND36801.1 efflux RND transporter periplasmic adaptor subunit [Gammaproteobacteria bacterium]
MNRTATIYGTAIVVMASLMASCQEPPAEFEEVIRPVRYAEVLPAGAVAQRIFSGVTKAALDADLSFKVGGNVTTIDVVVGDRVDQGQLVAQLDPTDYAVTMREAEAGLQRARAELRNAEANFNRTRELYENRNVSKSDLDNSRAASESANALVAAARQQLEAARLQLSYSKLTSPEDCMIAGRYVEPNQNVSAGQPVVRVNCGECPEVVVDVPGAWIGAIRQGAPATVSVAELGNRRFGAVVSEVGVAAERGASAYPVTLGINENCGDIRSGMAAEVQMSVPGDSPNGILIPYIAVGEDHEGNYVFVLEAAGEGRYVARRRAVTIEESPNVEGIPVIDGVKVGELIATAGVRRLVDGQTVTLLED